MTISILPTGAPVGAQVLGIDLSKPLNSATFSAIERAFNEYGVIFFRDQDVSREEHIAFGRRFGELEIHPFATNHPDHPEIVVIHHDERSKSGQNSWHSDVTWREQPSLGSILRGRVIPDVGGDTLFADMQAAYEGLAVEIRQQIDKMNAVHSYTRVFGGKLPAEQQVEMRAKYPDVRHPVIRTHPETGEESLYVQQGFVQRVRNRRPFCFLIPL